MGKKKHVILSETATASLSSSSLGKVPIYNIDTNDFDLVAGGEQFTSKYLISGGASWSGMGLTYDITTIQYYFNGNKTAEATNVTLDASDPDNNRFDAIVVDEDGVISIITGEASATPITPSIPDSHLLIQYILVEASTTEPNITKEDIYLENTEWTTSTYTTGLSTGSIDFDSASSPKQGVKCISANSDARLGARFVRTTSFDPYQYTMLSLWVRFTGSNVATNKSLKVRFEDGAGALVANTINLFNFGLQRNLLNVWQLVVIPITAFGVLPTSVKGLKIIMTGGTVGQARQWDIDLISLTDNSVPTINEQVFNVLKDGALVGQSSSLNFKGAPITVTNDPINKKIDVEVTEGNLFPNGVEIVPATRDFQASDVGKFLVLLDGVGLTMPVSAPFIEKNKLIGVFAGTTNYPCDNYFERIPGEKVYMYSAGHPNPSSNESIILISGSDFYDIQQTVAPANDVPVFLNEGDLVGYTSKRYLMDNVGGGGTPAGSDTWVQYNNAGAFGADALFTRDAATGNANLAKDVIQQSTVTFTGSGLDDLQIAPTFSGSTPTTYTITISSTGTPDTFDWTDGVNSGTNVPIDLMGNALSNGLFIGFMADTGHTNGDSWSWTYTKPEKFAFKLTDDFGGNIGSGLAGVLQKYENTAGGINREARNGIFEISEDGESFPIIEQSVTDNATYSAYRVIVDGIYDGYRDLSTNSNSTYTLKENNFSITNTTFPADSKNGISFNSVGTGLLRLGNLSGGNGTKITIDDIAQTINFNNNYSFPFADGAAGQVLGTDGSGQLGWQSVSGGGGQIAFTKTKAEIDALIAGNNLVKNALYEITGVHPTLYDDGTTSGTTVYLRAISGSELEVQGMGKFYNPKYNQSVDGFGIWDNKMYGTLTSIVGQFDYKNKEGVTANNGATGLMLAAGMIQWVSGNWSAATSITGDVSGATANIAGFISPSYGVGDKVIWGGYSWTNVNGNIGSSVDVLNLNAEWTKNVYDTTNYNIAYDVIEYDYANDMIIRRFEKESNVDVKCNKAQYDLFYNNNGFPYHSISVQQFGNVLNISTYKGQLSIIVENGYNESINFSGAGQSNLTFGIGAVQNNLTFGSGAVQVNLTFGSNAYQQNLTFGNGAVQYNLTFGNGAVQYNLTFGNGAGQVNLTFGIDASQENLTFGSGAGQNYLTFGSNAGQFNLTFGSGAGQSNLTFGSDAGQNYLTFGSNAGQSYLSFGSKAYQGYLTFGSNANQQNLTFAENTQLNYNSQTINSNIEYVNFRTKAVTIPNLSTATYIYDGNIKEVYQRPDGALKIRYHDNTDALQIVDIDT